MSQSTTKLLNRKPHRSLGLEITDRTLKVVELHERKYNKTRVVGYRTVHLPEGVIVDGRIKDKEQLRAAIDQLIPIKGRKSSSVHLSVPFSLVMARTLQLPDLSTNELRRIVQYEMKNNLQVAFEEPFFDFVKLPKAASDEEPNEETLPSYSGESLPEDVSEGKGGKETCNVLVVAAPKTELSQYVQIIESLRLKPASIEIASLSALRLLEMLSLGRLGLHIFVNLGRYSSEVTIFEDGIFRMNRQIEVEFSALQQEAAAAAETLEPVWFTSFSDPDQQFHQSARELIGEIERIMDFYYYTIVNQRGNVFKKIWVGGDAAGIGDIIEQMQQQLSTEIVPVEWGKLGVDQPEDGWQLSQYAVCLGLALRGGER